jgi:formylglycine-generating enzyme
MVLIKPGPFLMGSPSDEPGRGTEEIRHKVTLTRRYYLCDHEVTQAEWVAVMKWNLSLNKGSDLPVEEVTWFDCVEYCNKRSEREKLTPAYEIVVAMRVNEHITKAVVTWKREANGYRLPTEAEWEYACRAGTQTAFSCGTCLTAERGNFDGREPLPGCPAGRFREAATPVKSYAPNPWGLYDMHGNVYEWCWDWRAAYPAGAVRDPLGPESGERRIFRGGGWNASERFSRSACREDGSLSLRGVSMGVRVGRNAP